MISKKIEKLKVLTDWFQGADFKLDEAVEKYQEADKLAKEIIKDLDSLKNKIEVISGKTPQAVGQ